MSRALLVILVLCLWMPSIGAAQRASTDFEAGDLDGVHYGDNYLEGWTQVSMAIWVRPESLSAAGSILRKASGTGGVSGFLIWHGADPNDLFLNIDDDPTFLQEKTTNNANYSVNEWAHIGVRWTGGDGTTVTFYKDGVTVADNDDPDNPSAFASGTEYFAIGLRCDPDCSGGEDTAIDGLYAHALLWDTGISEGEIIEAMICPNSIPANLQLWNPLWDSDHKNLSNNSGVDGTEVNSPAASSDGPPVMLCG